MSDNKLLAENTVRRFMKLANVGALTDTFINETYASKMKDDKEKTTQKEEAENAEEVVEESEEEIELNEEEELELNEEDIDEMMGSSYKDEDAEMEDLEGGEEPGQADLSLSEEEAQVIIDLGKRLEEAMAGQMGDEDTMGDPDAAGEDVADLEEPEMPEDEDEDPSMMAEERDAIVQEVLKRVAKRLVTEKLKRS